MGDSKSGKKARLRAAQEELEAALDAQRALASRIAELESRRARADEDNPVPRDEVFDLATRLSATEHALRASRQAEAEATAAAAASEALLAAAGDRLAELGGVADLADRLEAELEQANDTIARLNDSLDRTREYPGMAAHQRLLPAGFQDQLRRHEDSATEVTERTEKERVRTVVARSRHFPSGKRCLT